MAAVQRNNEFIALHNGLKIAGNCLNDTKKGSAIDLYKFFLIMKSQAQPQKETILYGKKEKPSVTQTVLEMRVCNALRETNSLWCSSHCTCLEDFLPQEMRMFKYHLADELITLSVEPTEDCKSCVQFA